MTAKRLGVGLLVGGAAFLAALALARRPLTSKDTAMLAAPDERSVVILQRSRARDAVTERLLAGELNLTEAAAWFRYLNDNPPAHRTEFRDFWPGDSDGEKLCRQVIHWALGVVSARSGRGQGAYAVEPLERELRGLLAGGGTVELPW